MIKTISILLTVGVLFACQTPMQVGSQCVLGPGAMDNAGSFTWRNNAPVDLVDETGYISPMVLKSLEEAVSGELTRKGFSYSNSDASAFNQPLSDLEVALTLRTRRELASISSEQSPCQDVDCWERIDYGSQTRMDIRTVGFLAADIYYRGEPVWRGWVETALYPKDRDQAAAVISRAVPKLFESFPP